MKKTVKTVLIIVWSAAILWCALCIFLSWQTGEQTSAVSGRLASYLLRILRHFGKRPDAVRFHMLLRRAAHAAVFFVMGILFGLALTASVRKERWREPRVFSIASAVCVFFALTSEVVKTWIPGRHLQWNEVGLNVIGAVVGVVVICVTDFLITRILRCAEHWDERLPRR